MIITSTKLTPSEISPFISKYLSYVDSINIANIIINHISGEIELDDKERIKWERIDGKYTINLVLTTPLKKIYYQDLTDIST